MRPMAICVSLRGATSLRRRSALRAAVTAVALPLLLLALPASASAASTIDRAVDCLRSQPVCVDPAARQELPPAQARSLSREISARHAGPMFVAVLPQAAEAEVSGGGADGVLRAVHDRLGEPGTYAIVA